MMAKNSLFAAFALSVLATAAHAADPVKIGFITTLSTPAGYLGADQRDAFLLAMGEEGGKLGGVPVELVVEDDGLKPASGKQAADRMLQDGIKLFSGITFSNVLGAVAPGVLAGDAFYVSTNAGPSTFAGKDCNKNYFVASYQNDAFHSAGGVAANELGYKKVVLLAPNYQAGRDALEGFKRTFKGTVEAEIYTKLDQNDFSVEMARIRSLAPDAVYQFHPGGAGITFVKQYNNAGLSKSVPLLMPGFSLDTRMIEATGNAGDRAYLTGIWSPETDTPASKAFVAAFRKAYNRTPTLYAQQAYDAAKLIGSGLKAVNGDLGKADAFRAALKKADFKSIRGDFKFGNNNHPIQDYYLMQLQRSEGGSGPLVPVVVRRVLKDDQDVYAKACAL